MQEGSGCSENTKKESIMKVSPSDRISSIREYYFSCKLQESARLKDDGNPDITLGLGSPDQPPHPTVREVLCHEASLEEGHVYQCYYGIPELREAFSQWYDRMFGIKVDAAGEILPLIGSKEGIMHISMSFLNPGDEVLVP